MTSEALGDDGPNVAIVVDFFGGTGLRLGIKDSDGKDTQATCN